jgi:type I restriction enzyme S subunit
MIQGRFPLISLGDITSLDIDKVTVDPSKSYKMVGVFSYGKGLFKRETVDGSSTSYKHFYRLHSHHVVMSQLFGWEGALALCQPDFVDCFVSPQFPTFACDDTKLDREFLGWLLRFPPMWAELGTMTKGMGDRRRTLNPDAFFAVKIPLPALEEQLQVVTRIKNISAKVEEAKKLKQDIQSRLDSLVTSLHLDAADTRMVLLSDILELHEQREEIQPGNKYPQVGIRGFGGGIFAKDAVIAQETSYKHFNKLYPGALVLSQVKGWEGAIAVCPTKLEGRYASPEYRTFRVMPGQAVPEYLDYVVRSKWFAGKLNNLRRGVGARRERTRPEKFLSMKAEMPTFEVQQKLLPVFQKTREASESASANVAQLDALLPSILDKAFRGKLNIEETKHRSAKVVPIQRKNTASEAFQEAVLIARLVRDFASDEYLLSRKRYTKLAYLFHRKSKDDVRRRYLKKAAGPYSPWTKYQGPEKIALTNQYIQTGKKEKYSGFKPGSEIDQIDRYFATYWDEGNIAWLIERFKYKSTDNLEVLATVDMAMLDLVDQGRVVSLETVKDVIASEPEWVPKLSREVFSDAAIAEAIRDLQGWFMYA